MDMKKSESLKLVSIAALLILTPLISTPFRFKYLYFILNILIITLGAEAGLLSFFLQSPQNKSIQPLTTRTRPKDDEEQQQQQQQPADKSVTKVVQKCSSEKINLKKSPSTPSIFFIGDDETSREEEQVGDPSGQELFHKSETFIGNFYKELKMQREESRNKLHRLSLTNPFNESALS